MNLTERLRTVVRPGGSYVRRPADSQGPSSAAPAAADDTADLLGGDWHEWQSHRYLVVDRRYAPGHRHGRVAVADGAPDADGWWPALGLLLPAFSGGRVLFVDLETTGLSGAAGTYPFLIGCGWFDGPAFRVRQLLLTGYAAEPGLLNAMRETSGGAGAVGTYNGKTFDLPVLEMRCVLHRQSAPFDGLPHLDMLHPARQLWRRPAPADGCDPSAAAPAGESRLAAIEASVLGHVRDRDVPGFEIPSRYFHFVRFGDPRPLAAVLEHNRLDLLSLAMLTGRLAQLIEQGADAAGTAREALGLGRLYQRAERLQEARTCFARAIELGGDAALRADALRAYALLCRRVRQHDEAAHAWRQLLDGRACSPRLAREAREALAVHCEHRLRDYPEARRLAVESLGHASSAARTGAIHHRLARLDRKLGFSF